MTWDLAGVLVWYNETILIIQAELISFLLPNEWIAW